MPDGQSAYRLLILPQIHLQLDFNEFNATHLPLVDKLAVLD
jgi:hypothetical protein